MVGTMISKNARAIILELVDIELDRLHTNFNSNNDNDLTYFVFQFHGGIEQSEQTHKVEFYD